MLLQIQKLLLGEYLHELLLLLTLPGALLLLWLCLWQPSLVLLLPTLRMLQLTPPRSRC